MKRQLYIFILCICFTLLLLSSCKSSSDNSAPITDNTVMSITSDVNNVLSENTNETNLNEEERARNSIMLTDGTKNVIPVMVHAGDTFLD